MDQHPWRLGPRARRWFDVLLVGGLLVLALFLPDVAARVAARGRFDPDAPLLRFRLVELGDEPEQPATTLLGRTLRLDPRVDLRGRRR